MPLCFSAEAAGSSGKTWHAYLAHATDSSPAINARERIGSWYNADGVEAVEPKRLAWSKQ